MDSMEIHEISWISIEFWWAGWPLGCPGWLPVMIALPLWGWPGSKLASDLKEVR